MAIDVKQLRGMAQSFINTIANSPANERDMAPSEQFCDRYNQILMLAKETLPDVDARLWPQPIQRGDIPNCRYVEIQTYAVQILNLLPPKPRISLSEMQAQARALDRNRW